MVVEVGLRELRNAYDYQMYSCSAMTTKCTAVVLVLCCLACIQWVGIILLLYAKQCVSYPGRTGEW